MTANRPLRVFLCHSSADKPAVRELYDRLVSEGWIDPWLDEEKFLPGQNWEMEIERAVESTDAVIVCLSIKSINKEGYIQKEMRKVLDIFAQKPDGTIFVIPLRLDNCQPPVRLQALQYVDYFPDEKKAATYQKILKSLDLRFSTLPPDDMPKNIPAIENKAFSRLSRQGKFVLLLVSEGKTNRQIASTLLLGEGTIRNYVKSNLLKLGFSNRAEAAAYAIDHNLKEVIRI
jgi:DNA-binding NarL/FixJ family response regulator